MAVIKELASEELLLYHAPEKLHFQMVDGFGSRKLAKGY